MLQRKQSVFYFIAILALAIPMLGFALVTFSVPEPNSMDPIWTQKVTLFGNSFVTEEMEAAGISPISSYPLYILNLTVIFILLVTIFAYKNLKRQAQLGKIALWGVLITSVVFLIVIYNFYNYTAVLRPFMELGLVMHFTVASALFILLGNRGVRKDQKLLASVDRIR